MLSDVTFCNPQWEVIAVAVGHVLETMVREAKVDRDLQSTEPRQQTRRCVNTRAEFGFNDVLGFHWKEIGGQTVGNTGKPSANNVHCRFFLAKWTLVFYIYSIYNLESIWKLCMCTGVCVWLLATPCDATIAGFCLARLWEEGDRRVNEWRGFMDASAQGCHEGVGGRALKLNNTPRTGHSATSRDGTHASAQSTKRQVKSCHSATFPVTYGWHWQEASIGGWLFGLAEHLLGVCLVLVLEVFGVDVIETDFLWNGT